MDEKYTKLYVVCATFDYEGITSLTFAFHNEEDAIAEMNRLNYGKQSDLFVYQSVELVEYKEVVQIKCLDCVNGMVTNSVSGEPDDCYTCGGSYLEEMCLDDAPIRVEALEQRGWNPDIRGRELYTDWQSKPSNDDFGVVDVHFNGLIPEVTVYDGEDAIVFKHIKTMKELDDLVLLYTGEPVQKGINNAVE